MTRSGRITLRLLVGFVVALGFAAPALAHEIRPALLDIVERSPGLFDVTWKVPMRGDMILGIAPALPPSLEPIGPPSDRLIPGARVQRFTCKGSAQALIGERISIDGLSSLQIDVLLRIELADGTSHSAILRPSSPYFDVPARASKADVALSYTRMGMIHILEGVDHLLFLFAMLLLVTGLRKLLLTITAFTVAHSITLALATLGAVNVPPGPTEAVIALSIVFLAVEIIRQHRGEQIVTAKYPWVVSFAFGLFHGLGFAGALSEVGVPSHEVPLALLMFNVGVEAGQILFVIAVVGLLAVLHRVRWPKQLARPWSRRLVPYLIGCIAAFWTIERVVSAIPVAAWS